MPKLNADGSIAKSHNTIKSIRRITKGDQYTTGDMSGYFRVAATEPGYFLQLADSVVFVPDRALQKADAAEGDPVLVEDEEELACSLSLV